MPPLKKEQLDAAEDFVGLTLNTLGTAEGVHAETAVAGAARMAGTFLFRSFGFPKGSLAPGRAVLSEQANTEGPALIQLLVHALTLLGVTLDQSRLGAPDPAHQAGLPFLDTQRKLEPLFEGVRGRHGLSLAEAAQSAALAAAMVIDRAKGSLDPHAGFNVAVYGFIEGTKTVPDPP